MRRGLVWLVALASVVAGVAAANFRRESRRVEVDWRLFRPAPPAILVGTPTRGPIARTVAAKGVVEPVRQARVVAKIGGKVAEVCVEEGSAVREGDVLVKLDPAPYRTRADSARARLDAATKNLAAAEAHLRDVEKDPAAATAPATPVAATPLVGIPGVPPAAPPAGPTRLDAARDNVEGWRRERKAADAADQSARTDLDRATIRAPLAGVVEDLAVEVGDDVFAGPTTRLVPAVAPSAPAGMLAGLAAAPDPTAPSSEVGAGGPGRGLCTIMDPARLRVRAWVDEGDVGLIAPDQPAQVFLPDEPTRPVPGRITRVAARGKPTGEVIAYAATIELAGVGSRARAGMRVNVEVEVSRAADLLGVPVQAVVHRKRRDLAAAEPTPGEGAGFRAVPAAQPADADPEYVKAVFVVEGDRVRLRPIATGLSDERRVQVVAGLGADDRIVVGPFRSLDTLEDRMAVRRDPASGEDPAARGPGR